MVKPACRLSDVAAEAGVSSSTVSRILNDKLGNGFSVKDEVLNRVLLAAKKLNYRPNLIAKSLTLQTTRMIHIIGGYHALGDLGNIYQTVVNQATQVLDNSEQVFDITIDMSRHNIESTELPNWRIDGAIILAKATPATMKELDAVKTPYVVVNGPALKNGSSIVPDDIDGTQKAIKYLAKLGHKRIAYANSRPVYLTGHKSLTDRHDTYISQMKELNLPIIPGHDDWLESAEEFLKAAVIENGATAVLAYGHMEGLNLMQAAHILGISVPSRLSMLCFCDNEAAGIMSPGLSFIDLNSADMGRTAAELLLKLIEKHNYTTPGVIKLPESVMERGSTVSIKN